MLAVLFALLGFCFVVVIHELGHFLFAKWAGVRVDAFSIGFGPVLWAKRVGETEYRISLIWAGGYVAMPGEVPGADGADDPRSLNKAKPGWKALILLGGVLFNLVSSWVLLVVLALVGMPLAKPIVGGLDPKLPSAEDRSVLIDSPAVRLGMQVGDEIRAVNGIRTRSFDDVLAQVTGGGDAPVRVTVRRDGKDLELSGDGNVRPVKTATAPIPVLGFEMATSRRIDAVADFGGILGEKGRAPGPVQRGWTITAINGEAVGTRCGQELDRMLAPHLGTDVSLSCITDTGVEHQTTFRYAGTRDPIDLALGLPVVISGHPFPGSPAAEAGLQAGDVLTAVAGQRVMGFEGFSAALQQTSAGTIVVTRWRDGQAADVTLRVEAGPDGKIRVGIPIGTVRIGWIGDEPSPGTALAEAGISAASCLFGLDQTEAERTQQTLRLTVVDGGERLVLPLAADTKVSDLRALVGTRVTAREGQNLRSQRDETTHSRELPPELAALAVDDRIIAVGDHGDGQAMIVLRGGTAREVTLKVNDVGYAIGFTSRDKTIYQLEGGFGEAMDIANRAAIDTVKLTLAIIPRFFRPNAADGIDATKALSGPIGIFGMLRESFNRWGFAAWLHLVCLIGFNLFLINLLPIPVVDGGQLVVLGIETIMRRPLPLIVRNFIFITGFVMVVALMLFVIGIDLYRIFF